ncbi:MAG: fibronectin type III domain-containing protein [Candidatus Brocadiae bacterium]|nr:fibronectin type III domain-containing protein [Candidatus Brocadiia bacterium]
MAPGATTDLSLTGTTHVTATLTWTAAGDDLASGDAAAYDLRWATTPIVSDADYGAATEVEGEPDPATPGSPETMTIPGLSPETEYWFALKTLDEAGNASPISNVVHGSTQPPPDLTPPAAVTDLEVTAFSSVSATLRWTAPADDGDSGGAASSYDLRYSTAPIDEAGFEAATPVTGVPAPGEPGDEQSCTIGDLTPGQTYWFALRASDEVPNVGPLSNVVSASLPLPDTTAPAAIGDLTVSSPTSFTLTLSWTAPGDDGGEGVASAYLVRYATAPILTDADFEAATPVGNPPTPGPAGTAQTLVVKNLAPSTSYWFAVRAVDEAQNLAALSNSPEGKTAPPPDLTAPAGVNDLAVVAWTDTTLTLSWTAPGDDGWSGTAALYEIRVSPLPISSESLFDAAGAVAGAPAPQPGGTAQTFVVTGLTPGTTAYFALRARDEAGNVGAVSNSAAGTTSLLPVTLTVGESEPNNTGDTADPLPPGTAGHGHLDTLADLDYWSFQANAGDVFTIELFGTRMTQATWNSSNAIPLLRLLSPTGETLLRHDRGSWKSGDHDLDIPLFRAPSTGTYMLRLQASGGNAVRKYAVLVRPVPLPLVHEQEAAGSKGANDTVEKAESLTLPATVYGWHVDNESDCYSFEVQAPSILRFEVVAYRNGISKGCGYINPRVWVYDPSGKLALQVSDSIFEDVEFSWLATTSGKWTVRVFDDGGSYGDGPYFLHVGASPAPAASEAEPNNGPAQANPIGYGDFRNGSVDKHTEDWFSFTGAAGDLVRVKIYDVANREDAKHHVTVDLFASDGTTEIPSSPPEGVLHTARALLRDSGTCYIRVKGTTGSGTLYSLELERFLAVAVESEPNDPPAAADVLDLAGRVSGLIAADGDVDVFSFAATSTELVTLAAYARPADVPPGSDGDSGRSGHGSTMSPKLTVRDEAGQVLATSADGLSKVSAESITNPLPTLEVTFVAPASGTYTVTVEDVKGKGSPTGTYTIRRR